MADLEKTVKVIFSGDDEKLSKAVAAIGGKFDALGGIVGNVTGPLAAAADSVMKVDAALAALAVGGMALAVRESKEFNQGFALISTSVDAVGGDLERYRKQILDYSTTSSKRLEDINAALYTAAQAGVKYTESLEFMRETEKLAVANHANLNTTVDLLTGTMNAYGFTIKDISHLSDVLFQSTLIGKQTIDELGQSMGQVVGIAATAGVSFEELSAAISTLTAKGMNTPDAITAIKAVIATMISPAEKAAKAADALGLNFSVSSLQARGFAGMMADVMQATGGSAEKMTALFSNIRAMNGALSLTGDGMAFFNDAMNQITNSTGAAEEAYAKMAATFENQSQMLVNVARGVMIEVGTRLEPVAAEVAGSLSELLRGIKVGVDSGAFDALFETLDKIKAAVAEFLSGMAAALPDALEGLEFDNLLDALRQLGEAFRSYFGDIDLTAVEDLHDFIQLLIDGITGLIRITAGMVEGFRPFFIAIKDFLMGMAQGDTEAQKMLGTVMALAKAVETFGLALAASAVAADQYGAKVTGVFSTVAGAAQVLWNGLQLVANAIQGLFVVLESVLIELLDTLSFGLFSEKFDRMREVVNETGKKISESMMENGMDAARGLDRLIGGLSELGGQSHKTAEEVSAAGKKIADSVPEKVVTEWQFEGIDNVKKALADIGKTIVGVDEVSLEETKTEIVEVLGDTHKIDVEVDLDEEDLKKKAASVDKALEWRARLDMAEAEAAVKKFKDAAESVNVGIKDTGDLISDLFRQLGQSGRWNESIIRDQIASENEMRRKQFELQEKLIGQQIELNDLKLSNARDGKMMIDINAAGLQPHLEMILWEILEQIQIRANATSAEFLLGL